jgi:uncharacterized protein
MDTNGDEIQQIDRVEPAVPAPYETVPIERHTTPLQQLHPAIQSVWRWGALLSGLTMLPVLGGLSIVFWKVAHLPLWLSLVLGLGIAFFVGFSIPWFTANRQYEAWRYQLREYDLMIQKGIWWRSERYIARDRVQHIDINSGPFDRKFGLVQVVVYAAGSVGSVGLIPGLKPEEAEWLKEQLLATRAMEA